MKSFDEFVADSARSGHLKLIFERGTYFVAEDLEQLLKLFEQAQVPFELIGGVAVNAHLLAAAQRSRSFVTRDIESLCIGPTSTGSNMSRINTVTKPSA